MDYEPYVNLYLPCICTWICFMSYSCGHNYFLYTYVIQDFNCFIASVCTDMYILYLVCIDFSVYCTQFSLICVFCTAC